MREIMKNIGQSEVLELAAQVEYLPGQIASKTLAQNKHHSLTLFAFDKGEEISTHESGGDAMVVALDGVGRITIDGKDYELPASKTIIMPAKIAHAVYAVERFKMMLLVLFPEE